MNIKQIDVNENLVTLHKNKRFKQVNDELHCNYNKLARKSFDKLRGEKLTESINAINKIVFDLRNEYDIFIQPRFELKHDSIVGYTYDVNDFGHPVYTEVKIEDYKV